MRIRAITPIRVSEEELARRQNRYRELSSPPVEVDVVNLPEAIGVPEKLDTERDIRASEELTIREAMETDPARYDAILSDCVLDPGLEQLENEAPVPAFGILKLSAGFLLSLGHRLAAFTRNRPIGEELRARLKSYGYLPHFGGVSVLDLNFEDIANDREWNEALKNAASQFAESPTTAVINGCSAAELRPDTGNPVTIIDPTKLALSLLGLAAESGLAAPSGANRSVGATR